MRGLRAAIKALWKPEPVAVPRPSEELELALRGALRSWLGNEAIVRAWIVAGQMDVASWRTLEAGLDSMESGMLWDQVSSLLKHEWVRAVIAEEASRQHGFHPAKAYRQISEWAHVR